MLGFISLDFMAGVITGLLLTLFIIFLFVMYQRWIQRMRAPYRRQNIQHQTILTPAEVVDDAKGAFRQLVVTTLILIIFAMIVVEILFGAVTALVEVLLG